MKSAIVEATWERLHIEMQRANVSPGRCDIARGAYIAALYAAAAAVTCERAHARELSESAFRLEKGPPIVCASQWNAQ